jgi:hypothetical protein
VPATQQVRRAVGPVDGPATDFADGQLGIVVAAWAADEVVGEQVSVAMAAAPAGDEPVERRKVAAQSLPPQQLPTCL